MGNENRLSDAPLDNSGWDELTDVDYSGDAIETFQVPEDIPPAAEFSEPPIGDSSTDVLKPILDVEDNPSSSEKEYKDRLFQLKEKINESIDSCSYGISKYSEEVGGLFSNEFKSGLDNLSKQVKDSDKIATDSLLKFIDAKYPSSFDEEKSMDEVQEARISFLKAANPVIGDKPDGIGNRIGVFAEKVFNGGAAGDAVIGAMLKRMAKDVDDNTYDRSLALVSYIEDPNNEDLKKKVDSFFDNDRGKGGSYPVGGDIYDYLRQNGSPREGVFDSTIAFSTRVDKDVKDYHDNIMNYIKFKIENAKDGFKPAEKTENSGGQLGGNVIS